MECPLTMVDGQCRPRTNFSSLYRSSYVHHLVVLVKIECPTILPRPLVDRVNEENVYPCDFGSFPVTVLITPCLGPKSESRYPDLVTD